MHRLLNISSSPWVRMVPSFPHILLVNLLVSLSLACPTFSPTSSIPHFSPFNVLIFSLPFILSCLLLLLLSPCSCMHLSSTFYLSSSPLFLIHSLPYSSLPAPLPHPHLHPSSLTIILFFLLFLHALSLHPCLFFLPSPSLPTALGANILVILHICWSVLWFHGWNSLHKIGFRKPAGFHSWVNLSLVFITHMVLALLVNIMLHDRCGSSK